LYSIYPELDSNIEEKWNEAFNGRRPAKTGHEQISQNRSHQKWIIESGKHFKIYAVLVNIFCQNATNYQNASFVWCGF